MAAAPPVPVRSPHGELRFVPRCQGDALILRVAHFRASQPVLQRRNFFLGQTLDDSHFHDLVWFNADGTEMQQQDWKAARQYMAWFLGGDASLGSSDSSTVGRTK